MFDAMGKKRRTTLRDRMAQLRQYTHQRGEISIGEVFTWWQVDIAWIRRVMRMVALLPGGYIFDEERDVLVGPKLQEETGNTDSHE